MAPSAVELEVDEFRRAFLPLDHAPRDTNDDNILFVRLEEADDLGGHDISEVFLQAFKRHCSAPRSTLSLVQPYKTAASTTSTVAALFRDEHATMEPSWSDQTVPVSFRRHHANIDPFDNAEFDDPYCTIKDAHSRILTHLTTTVEVLFAAQPRIFIFLLLIIGRRFRVLRWDHAGIITTPSIDYYENPGMLCDFIWCLSNMDDTALGFDPTTTRVLPGHIDFARMDVAARRDSRDADHTERILLEGESTDPATFAYARTMFRTSLASDWPRYKIRVHSGSTQRAFLVGKPTFLATGVFGRGTRGYVALDCETNRFVWLKDTWRVAHTIPVTEGDVLQRLNDAGIENIPTLVCHGDVEDQTTVTGDWWERAHSLMLSPSSSSGSSPSSCTLADSATASSKKRKRSEDDDAPSQPQTDGPLRQHQHYRIVVAEVALPLKDFRNGKQLASIVLDAIQAHYQAATNPKTLLLHRDISGGNILIYPKVKRNEDRLNAMVWTGILSDWELSRPVDDQSAPSKATQADQMGTYQFMSVNLLTSPSTPAKISDELEAFFHVLLYYAVRYLRSTCAHPTAYIDNYFNSYDGPGHLHPCGWKSLTMEVDEWLSTQFPHAPLLFSSPMDDLLETLLDCFQAHYKVLRDDMAKTAPPLPEPKWPPYEPSADDFVPCAIAEIVFFGDDAIDDDSKQRYDDDDSDGDDNNTPTPEDRDWAARVVDHKFVLDLFKRMVQSCEWPKDDRVPSTKTRMPVSSGPPNDALAAQSLPTSNKRRRLIGPEPFKSVRTRLHPSTRRTRLQPLPAARMR